MKAVPRLFDHMHWADEHVLSALRETENPPADALELFAHVVAAEIVWMDRIEGSETRLPVWPAGGLPDCATLADTARERYLAYLAKLTETELDREVEYANSKGRRFSTPVWDILLHVALHGAYHRGQIARALRESGGTPEPTDYIAYVRGAPAATRD